MRALALLICSEVYTRSCSLHAYSTWSCIDWLLGDGLPGQMAFSNIYKTVDLWHWLVRL